MAAQAAVAEAAFMRMLEQQGLVLSPGEAYLLKWTLVNFLTWILLTIYFRSSSGFFKDRPGVAAYNIVSTLPILALCYHGLMGIPKLESVTGKPSTLQGRMYGFDPDAEKIVLLQAALQIFSLGVALVVRDKVLIKFEALAHHVVVGGIMCICVHPFVHAYACIMFGLTELSTLPLNVLDTLKTFKPLGAKYPTVFFISKATFSLSFLILRPMLSTALSYYFQRDLYELYTTGTAHSLPAVAFISFANAFVVLLQLYWGSLVFKGIYAQFAGESKAASGKKAKGA